MSNALLRKPQPCPVCGTSSPLYSMPFELVPDIFICEGCVEQVMDKAGCAHWEGCCETCPLFQETGVDDFCQRRPFPLRIIRYGPSMTYRKPVQFGLFGNDKEVEGHAVTVRV